MIVKVCHPKREDHFFNLSRYIRRDLDESKNIDNFASLSRYMTREEGFKTVATNCGCEKDDIDTAEQVVLATQNLNTRAKKKSLHLVVSFAKGERPPEEQLALIEDRLLASIGMDDLQRIRVVHDDTDFLHMHIAVNRIHPKSHLSIQPTRDYESLQRCARELELELGLEVLRGRNHKYQDLDLQQRLNAQKSAIKQRIERASSWNEFHASLADLGVDIRARRNGAVFVSIDERDGVDEGTSVAASRIDRDFSRSALEKRFGAMTQENIVTEDLQKTDDGIEISEEALRQERHRGTKSFQTWALEHREEIADLVESATTWEDVHLALGNLNLALVPYRAGLSLVNSNGRGAIAASRIDRLMSKNALHERLGEFEPIALENEPARDPGFGYTEQPYVNPFGLYDQYMMDRDALRIRLDRERERRKADRDRAFEDFTRKYASEAQSIRRNIFLDPISKRFAFNSLARRRKRSYEQLKSRSARTHSRRPPSYRQWLLQQALAGKSAARSALREMSSRLNESVEWERASNGRVQGSSKDQSTSIKPTAVFRDGAVEINHRGVPLIDDGERLHVTENDLDSVRALLDSACAKYDTPLEIDGSDEFKASVAICALEMPEIRFADRDLQHQVDTLRSRQRSGRESGLER